MKKTSTWQNTLERLKTGNANFVNNSLSNDSQDSIRRKEVLSGQNPLAVILACSDSRIVPELIFDTGIGKLFVIRIAGNIANTSSIASIEYAVAHLNIQLIVVLGHQNCGAITEALADYNNGKNLDHLLNFIQPAISVSVSKKVDDFSDIHTKLTAKKLIKESSIITNAVNTGDTKIVTAFYCLETGQVDFFE